MRLQNESNTLHLKVFNEKNFNMFKPELQTTILLSRSASNQGGAIHLKLSTSE